MPKDLYANYSSSHIVVRFCQFYMMKCSLFSAWVRHYSRCRHRDFPQRGSFFIFTCKMRLQPHQLNWFLPSSCLSVCDCVCVCMCVWGRGDKSELGKGFLMQRTPLPASIFCQDSVKDESPLGNSTSPQHSRTTPQVTHTHTHTHTRAAWRIGIATD